MHHNWAKAWENQAWFELWLSCCSMIPRSPLRSKRTRRRATLRAIRCYEKAGFERQGTVTTPDGPAVYMVQTRQHLQLNTQVAQPFHRGGRPRAGAGRPSCQTLNIMREAVIAEVSTQLSEVAGVIERHLEPTLLAVHLYGSAVDGGLKPHSDIDLLVTVTGPMKQRGELDQRPFETLASPERARFSAL